MIKAITLTTSLLALTIQPSFVVFFKVVCNSVFLQEKDSKPLKVTVDNVEPRLGIVSCGLGNKITHGITIPWVILLPMPQDTLPLTLTLESFVLVRWRVIKR